MADNKKISELTQQSLMPDDSWYLVLAKTDEDNYKITFKDLSDRTVERGGAVLLVGSQQIDGEKDFSDLKFGGKIVGTQEREDSIQLFANSVSGNLGTLSGYVHTDLKNYIDSRDEAVSGYVVGYSDDADAVLRNYVDNVSGLVIQLGSKTTLSDQALSGYVDAVSGNLDTVSGEIDGVVSDMAGLAQTVLQEHQAIYNKFEADDVLVSGYAKEVSGNLQEEIDGFGQTVGADIQAVYNHIENTSGFLTGRDGAISGFLTGFAVAQDLELSGYVDTRDDAVSGYAKDISGVLSQYVDDNANKDTELSGYVDLRDDAVSGYLTGFAVAKDVALSGYVDLRDDAVSGYVDSREASIRGYVDTRDDAVSGYAKDISGVLVQYVDDNADKDTELSGYVDLRDDAVSGYLTGFAVAKDVALSGYVDLRDDAVSGYVDSREASIRGYVDTRDDAVSGYAKDISGVLVQYVDDNADKDTELSGYVDLRDDAVSGYLTGFAVAKDVALSGYVDLRDDAVSGYVDSREASIRGYVDTRDDAVSGYAKDISGVLVQYVDDNADKDTELSGYVDLRDDAVSGYLTGFAVAKDVALSGYVDLRDDAVSGYVDSREASIRGYVDTRDDAVSGYAKDISGVLVQYVDDNADKDTELSGYVDLRDDAVSGYLTGFAVAKDVALSGYVDLRDDAVSGYVDSREASIRGYVDTRDDAVSGYAKDISGVLVQYVDDNADKDTELSGYVDLRDDAVSGYLTGFAVAKDLELSGHLTGYVDSQIQRIDLTDKAVLLETDQLISGVKSFHDGIVVSDLKISGDISGVDGSMVITDGSDPDLISAPDKSLTLDFDGDVYITGSDLYVEGDIIGNNIVSEAQLDLLSGYVNTRDDAVSGYLTGFAVAKDLELSGHLTGYVDSQIQGIDLTDKAVLLETDQLISGVKSFHDGIVVSDIKISGDISGVDGSMVITDGSDPDLISAPNKSLTLDFDGGVYITGSDLHIQGDIIGENIASKNQINDLSGYVDSQDDSISGHSETYSDQKNEVLSGYLTGFAVQKDAELSGYVNQRDNLISGYSSSINQSLSGYVDSRDDAVSGYVDQQIGAIDLTNSVVLLTTDQTVNGVKTFDDDVVFSDVKIRGDISGVAGSTVMTDGSDPDLVSAPNKSLALDFEGGVYITGETSNLHVEGDIIGDIIASDIKLLGDISGVGGSTVMTDGSDPDLISAPNKSLSFDFEGGVFITGGSNLYVEGDIIGGNLTSQAKLDSLSGYVDTRDDAVSGYLTGFAVTKDLALSGYVDTRDDAVSGYLTGFAVTKDLALSGYVDTRDDAVSGYLTGFAVTKDLALSGYVDTRDDAVSGYLTGFAVTKDLALSGYVDTRDDAVSGYLTGFAVTKDLALSGYVDTRDDAVSGYLTGFAVTKDLALSGHLTGFAVGKDLLLSGYIDEQIEGIDLTDTAVLLKTDQLVSGIKSFSDGIVVSDLKISGDISGVDGSMVITDGSDPDLVIAPNKSLTFDFDGGVYITGAGLNVEGIIKTTTMEVDSITSLEDIVGEDGSMVMTDGRDPDLFPAPDKSLTLAFEGGVYFTGSNLQVDGDIEAKTITADNIESPGDIVIQSSTEAGVEDGSIILTDGKDPHLVAAPDNSISFYFSSGVYIERSRLLPDSFTNVSETSYQILKTDAVIGVDTNSPEIESVKGCSLTLPEVTELNSGQMFSIKDIGGNATSNPIVVQGKYGENIDGESTLNLDNDYSLTQLFTDRLNWYIM